MIIAGKTKLRLTDQIINTVLKLKNSELFVKKTVEDLISGYNDTIMTIAKDLFPYFVKENKFSLLFGVR